MRIGDARTFSKNIFTAQWNLSSRHDDSNDLPTRYKSMPDDLLAQIGQLSTEEWRRYRKYQQKYKMSARKLFILIICYKENARIVCSMNCLSNQLTHYWSYIYIISRRNNHGTRIFIWNRRRNRYIVRKQQGWRKELNLVSWNGRPPKFDLRDWAPDHEKWERPDIDERRVWTTAKAIENM